MPFKIAADVLELLPVSREKLPVAGFHEVIPDPGKVGLRKIRDVPATVVVRIDRVHPAPIDGPGPIPFHRVEIFDERPLGQSPLVENGHGDVALNRGIAEETALFTSRRVHELFLRTGKKRVFHQFPHGIERGVRRLK